MDLLTRPTMSETSTSASDISMRLCDSAFESDDFSGCIASRHALTPSRSLAFALPWTTLAISLSRSLTSPSDSPVSSLIGVFETSS